uniref:Uncharacterized protein LOC111103269 n=1 Tax=Crassostrea virginica TaxID=6565 RepID=A0A8B8AKM9_CRAVI|nr:uncharacterized protein LOC111103269 [Crassostrea virginica]
MRSREIFLLPFGFEVVTAEFLDYTFHREKSAAFVHADSFISPIRLFHVSWGMESSSTASPGAIGPDFVTDENLSEGNAIEAPPLRPKKRWGDFVIPKKRNDDEEGDNTDPYADSESDADSVQSGDLSDGEISPPKSARPRTAIDACDDEQREPKRFDPGDFDSEYKLDTSKEKYVKKFFTTHLSDERINASVLDNHPVPANNFLNPPEVDAYIEDLVNDKRAFKFLKLQDQALKHVQRKVSRCLGPLAEIWEELDGAQEGDKSGKSIQKVAELVEKTILMIGQVNTACLYERRLTWLAKLFKSVANAKTIIKDHNDEFDKEVKLFGADFYSVLDRKAKNRKRAREMAKEMRPAKRARPFQEGPSGGTSISSKPRGSTTWRANKPGQQKGDKPAFKTSKANKPFKARR